MSAVSASAEVVARAASGTAHSPLRTMVAHEWRVLRADRMLLVVALLFAALLGVALWNGVTWSRFQTRVVGELAQADSSRFARYADTLAVMTPGTPLADPFAPDPRNPMTIGGARGGITASLTPSQLSMLAVGQSDLMPYYYRVTTGLRQAVLKGDEIENPGNLLTGRFDLAFVIVVLFPLVILALSYNMLSGEREDGTLALVLSQPVQLRSLIFAKLGVRAVTVLSIAAALVLAGLAVARVDLTAAGQLSTSLWWFAIVVAYTAFWFGVALVVNVLVRGSAASAVTVVTVWLVLVVLAPVLVNLVAQARYPTPSRVAFTTNVRTVTNDANKVADRLLSKYLVDHPELATAGTVNMDDFWTRTFMVQDTIEKTLAPYYDAFDAQLAQQQAVVTTARVLTPALLMQTALEDLAGTGLTRWQRFRAQTLDFHSRWQRFFSERQMRQQKMSASDLPSVPRFTYVEEPGTAVAHRVLSAILWLLLPAGALWAFGLSRLRRYSVAG
ncbi:MAG: DUF3526 domain-containing protein [Gemmatimonadaceae bacterium]|nr:DUF3526 domain-containing protein [Gemmatimonadaceae bacterium]